MALPLAAATAGLFTKELLLSAKGKFFVNVGRGPVVYEEGLYPALKGSTREAGPLNMEETLANIAAWLAGEPCANEADLREQY